MSIHSHGRESPEKARATAKRWRENNREKDLAQRRAQGKRYYQLHKEELKPKLSAYAREITRFRNYGLTKEMFEEFLDAQEGCCALCAKPLNEADWSKIAIDHDHATGKYRGLVHHGCNRAIGITEEHLAGYLAVAAYA